MVQHQNMEIKEEWVWCLGIMRVLISEEHATSFLQILTQLGSNFKPTGHDRELNIESLHIKMDCKELVTKLQSHDRDLSTLGLLIAEVRRLLESCQRWKGSWVRRSANCAAHGFAKVGVGNNLCKVWLHEPP